MRSLTINFLDHNNHLCLEIEEGDVITERTRVSVIRTVNGDDREFQMFLTLSEIEKLGLFLIRQHKELVNIQKFQELQQQKEL